MSDLMSRFISNRKKIIFVRSQKAAGKCVQCQHPWYDGTCSCGKWGAKEERFAMEVEKEMRSSIREQKSKIRGIDDGLLSEKELEKLWTR